MLVKNVVIVAECTVEVCQENNWSIEWSVVCASVVKDRWKSYVCRFRRHYFSLNKTFLCSWNLSGLICMKTAFNFSPLSLCYWCFVKDGCKSLLLTLFCTACYECKDLELCTRLCIWYCSLHFVQNNESLLLEVMGVMMSQLWDPNTYVFIS